MAAVGVVLRQNLSGNVDHCGGSYKGSPEIHVLAVDDSLIDRKVIEKLLRSLSCKGTAFFPLIIGLNNVIHSRNHLGFDC